MIGPRWFAPAKLNLFLHIIGRRADGYHELQTVFQFLDFGDDLSFKVRDDGVIRRINDVPDVPAAGDLCVRAAQALARHSGRKLGCDITLNKRIPLGGGLGGASSDAATTLVALNELWNLKLPEDELAALGLTLGADVPVFVRGRAAWGEGVGEILTPVVPTEPYFLVVTPPQSVNTREMYAVPELPRSTKRVTWDDYLGGRFHNDFEPVVRKLCPPVGQALDWAGRFGRARLSGSGASVFVDFPTLEAAEAARKQVPAPWRSIVARGLNRSPLHHPPVA